MSRKSYAGSYPEEQYEPATRQKMFLDRPTSHGGWPEGEYDPPVQDRLYGWYKKMKMMPESDEPTTRGMASSEQRRDLQKGKHGGRLGYLSDPESQELAHDLAQRIMSSPDNDSSDALDYVRRNPEIAMNVWSELQSEGEYSLAKLVRNIADEYIKQRGKSMRITETALRRTIRRALLEAVDGDYADVVADKYVYRIFVGGDIQIVQSPSGKATPDNPIKIKKNGQYYQPIVREIKKTNPDIYYKFLQTSSSFEQSSFPELDQTSDAGESTLWLPRFAKEGVTLPEDILETGEAAKVRKCVKGEFTGCAYYVGKVLGKGIGNAWQAYNRDPLSSGQKFNAFELMNEYDKDRISEIFSAINKKGSPDGFNSAVRDFAIQFVPDQASLKSDLEIGDVVGMFHYDSVFHATALFGTISGVSTDNMSQAAYPPIVKNSENKYWDPSMYGKDEFFSPVSIFRNGSFIPTPNTHVGIVGAKVDGMPIIFHYIGDHKTEMGDIYATPLSAMRAAPGHDAIVWIASPIEDSTPTKKGEEKQASEPGYLQTAYDYWKNKLG